MPPTGPTGTIEYVADVSFSRHKLKILLPRTGRSVSDRKVVSACAAAVRSAVQGVTLDGFDHTHARYKISARGNVRREELALPHPTVGPRFS